MHKRTHMRVVLAKRDGEVRAEVDQRDFARAEGADIDSARQVTWTRYLTWSALTRAGTYTGTWDEFNNVDCIEATIVEEGPAAADADDPGRKDRGAGT